MIDIDISCRREKDPCLKILLVSRAVSILSVRHICNCLKVKNSYTQCVTYEFLYFSFFFLGERFQFLKTRSVDIPLSKTP